MTISDEQLDAMERTNSLAKEGAGYVGTDMVVALIAEVRRLREELAKLGKPAVPDVLPLVNLLYADHPAGCCLHVVLDDGNIEDDCVDSSIAHAMQAGHNLCLDIAQRLKLMSKTQRKKLYMSHR